jgi:polar amino acid transport system substrate-binding protein
MKRIHRWFVVIAAVALISSPAAHAGPVLDGIIKSGELRVGLTGNQPPLNATTKSGKLIGMDVDIANTIASNMGVEVKFVTMPFPKLLPALKKGKVDMVISSVTMTMTRNLDVAFVGPYYASGKGILTKKKNLAALQQTDGLNSETFTVAVLKDSTSQKFVEQSAGNAKLVLTESYDAAVGMLFVDKVDAVVADLPFCQFTAFRYQDKGLMAGESPLSFEPLGIAVREDALLINWLENYLKILKGSGALKLIYARWFQDGSWIKALP